MAQKAWAILFFGMGVTLPAKLVAIEENRIIAATLSFICTPLKAIEEFAPQLDERASGNSRYRINRP